ncbi:MULTISPECIES: tetratricopeptide repeat protein [unclassified Variovorax]|uniref:tetratricopeptide repeat protein n=1 Tax=unclassified Variovorax TaxID=663243 RepID=UPI003F514C7D
MSNDPSEAPHTLRSIQEMLGLSRSAIAGLIANGFVSPSRGPRNEYRFSFRDVVLLRTAHQLQAADISTRKIVRALQRLKATLPAELPLTGLRITAVGNTIAVRERDSQWEAESGQLLMDFEIAAARGSVSFVEHLRSEDPSLGQALADELFAQGEDLETRDGEAAELAYRKALAFAPNHADAYLNLGAMLCESERHAEAVALYDEALAHCPREALLHFNRAVALEDLGQLTDALQSYERCLELDPALGDAHFNAARLHDHLGHKQEAIRHFSAYRRLQK